MGNAYRVFKNSEQPHLNRLIGLLWYTFCIQTKKNLKLCVCLICNYLTQRVFFKSCFVSEV